MKADLTKLRERILSEVENFGTLTYGKEFAFRPGIDPVPVSGKVLDPSDLVALVDSSLDGWLTAGRFTEEFERALSN